MVRLVGRKYKHEQIYSYEANYIFRYNIIYDSSKNDKG